MRQMKMDSAIMKKTWKILTILLLLCAGAFAPVHAETNETEETNSNNAERAPSAPPVPQPPAHHVEAEESGDRRSARPEYVVRPSIVHELENLLVPIVSVV